MNDGLALFNKQYRYRVFDKVDSNWNYDQTNPEKDKLQMPKSCILLDQKIPKVNAVERFGSLKRVTNNSKGSYRQSYECELTPRERLVIRIYCKSLSNNKTNNSNATLINNRYYSKRILDLIFSQRNDSSGLTIKSRNNEAIPPVTTYGDLETCDGQDTSIRKLMRRMNPKNFKAEKSKLLRNEIIHHLITEKYNECLKTLSLLNKEFERNKINFHMLHNTIKVLRSYSCATLGGGEQYKDTMRGSISHKVLRKFQWAVFYKWIVTKYTECINKLIGFDQNFIGNEFKKRNYQILHNLLKKERLKFFRNCNSRLDLDSFKGSYLDKVIEERFLPLNSGDVRQIHDDLFGESAELPNEVHIKSPISLAEETELSEESLVFNHVVTSENIMLLTSTKQNLMRLPLKSPERATLNKLIESKYFECINRELVQCEGVTNTIFKMRDYTVLKQLVKKQRMMNFLRGKDANLLKWSLSNGFQGSQLEKKISEYLEKYGFDLNKKGLQKTPLQNLLLKSHANVFSKVYSNLNCSTKFTNSFVFNNVVSRYNDCIKSKNICSESIGSTEFKRRDYEILKMLLKKQRLTYFFKENKRYGIQQMYSGSALDNKIKAKMIEECGSKIDKKEIVRGVVSFEDNEMCVQEINDVNVLKSTYDKSIRSISGEISDNGSNTINITDVYFPGSSYQNMDDTPSENCSIPYDGDLNCLALCGTLPYISQYAITEEIFDGDGFINSYEVLKKTILRNSSSNSDDYKKRMPEENFNNRAENNNLEYNDLIFNFKKMTNERFVVVDHCQELEYEGTYMLDDAKMSKQNKDTDLLSIDSSTVDHIIASKGDDFSEKVNSTLTKMNEANDEVFFLSYNPVSVRSNETKLKEFAFFDVSSPRNMFKENIADESDNVVYVTLSDSDSSSKGLNSDHEEKNNIQKKCKNPHEGVVNLSHAVTCTIESERVPKILKSKYKERKKVSPIKILTKKRTKTRDTFSEKKVHNLLIKSLSLREFKLICQLLNTPEDE